MHRRCRLISLRNARCSTFVAHQLPFAVAAGCPRSPAPKIPAAEADGGRWACGEAAPGGAPPGHGRVEASTAAGQRFSASHRVRASMGLRELGNRRKSEF